MKGNEGLLLPPLKKKKKRHLALSLRQRLNYTFYVAAYKFVLKHRLERTKIATFLKGIFFSSFKHSI